MISIDFGHEQLRGNRVFMYPISPVVNIGWQQLNPKFIFSNQNGIDATSDFGLTHGSHPTIKTGTAAPSPNTQAAYYSYWQHVYPEDGPKDFTIIARYTYRGADPGGGTGSFVLGARDSSANGGFLFGVWDEGGTDEGQALFLYSLSGSTWTSTSGDGWTDLINKPVVAAASYRAVDRTVRHYRDGALLKEETNAAAEWTPYVGALNKQMTIGRADAGFVFPGEISWIMVFDRALSDAEIVDLSRDSEWEFVEDEPLFLLEPLEATYTTEIFVIDDLEAGTAGSVTYTTEIDADFNITGDVEVGPPEPLVATFTTALTVASEVYLSEPYLGVFETTITVSSGITAGSPVTFTTEVLVSSRTSGLIDGRQDLIATARYRR